MNLNCETVLDVYTYKKRKILCQIKANTESGKFKNCRCLSQKQWMEFDRNLGTLIATIDDWNNEKYLKFNISPCIRVKIKKSSLSLKDFKKCLGIPSDCDGELDEASYILECLLDFKHEILFSPAVGTQDSKLYSETKSLDCVPSSPLSYDPYTPSKIKCETNKIDTVKTPGIDFLDWEDSTYSPKSVCGKASDESLPTAVNDTDYKSESRRNATDSPEAGNKSKESYVARKDGAFISPDSCSQTKSIDSKERSKSEDPLLEPYDGNAKEKHRSRRKKFKADKSCSHRDNKITRKPSRTLDEFREKLCPATEKVQEKIKAEEDMNKESHKKRDKYSYSEVSSQSEKEKKHFSSSKAEKSPEKQFKKSLIEDEATAANANAKKTSETPPVENDNSCDSTTETSPEKVAKRERKPKSCVTDTPVSLRRSERSPSKPKRLIDEQGKLLAKSKKKHKSSHKNRELFGTDDDEDYLFETKKAKNNTVDKIKTNSSVSVSTKSGVTTSSSSSKKPKRKRDKSAECQQEKREMSKWLSKKNSKPLDHETKTTPRSTSKSTLLKPLPLKTSTNTKLRKVESRSKSVTPPPLTIELPSKEELELMKNKTNLMREENARMRAELDKMRTSPPKEVEILSLENMPEETILSTFTTYKLELDEIYQNNRKKDYIKGHAGINHCLIIRLLQHSIQMKMLQKLTDVYGSSNSTIQATLFANALLPEWVIRVYMEKFNFTRQQAIDQIKAQEAFQLHMEEQNENSFGFD